MIEAQHITPQDPCPACGETFRRHRPATDAEWAAYTHPETPRGLPPRVDSMAPARVTEHGTLYRCVACGYQVRHHEAASFAGSAL